MSDYDDSGRWETVAISALPAGYVNVYREADGSYRSLPCAALLVQERRGTNRPSGRNEDLDPPYVTRVEAAETYLGGFMAASTTTNYAGTFGPGERWSDEEAGGYVEMPEPEPDALTEHLAGIDTSLDLALGSIVLLLGKIADALEGR